jgi:DNA-binding LacI/PurR family transcriptional regulator
MAELNELTTLRQPLHAIGKRAIEILLGHIRQEISAPHREFIGTVRILRSTVGAPRKV